MRGLNLSTKHQVKKNISDILFNDQINFLNLFRNRTELPLLLRKRCFMLARSERFKHFPIKRDRRTGMQRATLGKIGSEAASQLGNCQFLSPGGGGEKGKRFCGKYLIPFLELTKLCASPRNLP